MSQVAFPRPTQVEIQANVERTRAAIHARLVELGVETAAKTSQGQGPMYLEYKGTHTVQMVKEQVDPLAAPKATNRKVISRTVSPPKTIERSPPRAATKEAQAAWKVPLQVSEYKNDKGFIIPLEYRASKRQAVEVSDRHESIAMAMDRAERELHQEVEERARQERRLAEQRQAQEEFALRAAAARKQHEDNEERKKMLAKETPRERQQRIQEENDLAQKKREIHRIELQREKLRARTGLDVDVDLGRDDAEVMALGGSGGGTVEAHYDQRLMDEVQRGLQDTSEYGEYSGPLLQPGSRAFTLNRANLAREVELSATATSVPMGPAFEGVGAMDAKEEDPFAEDIDVLTTKRRKK